MASQQDNFQQLEYALRQIFPGSQLRVREDAVRSCTYHADVEVGLADHHHHLLLELIESSSRARLVDAEELMRRSWSEALAGIPVLASPYLSPTSQQLLRERGVAFLDFAGNAWIVASGLHIDRRGFRNPRPENREGRDIFSDKASLVLRELMMERSPMGIRQIAERVSSEEAKTQLTPGYVSKIVSELERRGYASRQGEKAVLRRSEELLNEWVISYRQRRHPESWSFFVPSPSAESLMPKIAEMLDINHVDYVFAGQAGASLVDRYADFDVVDVYIRDPAAAQKSLQELGGRWVERGGNVNLAQPYYSVSAFYGYQCPKNAMKAASDIQLYLDLYDYPVRGREQAEHLYERRLQRYLRREDAL
jgi:hypothetical protein